MSIREGRIRATNNRIAKDRLRAMRAYRLRERGYSCAEIGASLGICESAVRKIFELHH